MKLTSSWLSIAKYLVLLLIVLWIWRTIRKDSIAYVTYSQNSIENFDSGVDGGIQGFDVESVSELDDIEASISGEPQCKSCTAGGLSEDGVKLLPVMDPLFNMREICKQSILIEDHLNNPEKRCVDCITKHSLSIEALAEEAVGLDNNGKYKFMSDLAKKCRHLQKECNKKESDKNKLAQKYRNIRKSLMPICKDSC